MTHTYSLTYRPGERSRAQTTITTL